MLKVVRKIGNETYEGIDEIYNIHLVNLFKAILEVDTKYYYYSANYIAGDDDLQEQLERIFAYELYHQWSVIQDKYNKSVAESYKRVINGEAGKKLDGASVYPDLILHKGQDDTEHQEIAVEIKRKVGISGDNVIKDLEKLSKVITEGNLAYKAKKFNYGVFILTGGSEYDIQIQLQTFNRRQVDNRIICVFCNGDGELSYATIGEINEY